MEDRERGLAAAGTGRSVTKGSGEDEGFRWRGGGEIHRIEGFSDAVFAFAVTLLVVSLEVPKTFTELEGALRGLLAFAIGFAILFQIWFLQHRFFRRYGMQDTTTIVLNGALLFVVIAYVYPLKFLFSWLVNAFLGGPLSVTLADGRVEPIVEAGKTAKLMVLYGAGFVAVFTLFLLLHLHAWRRRRELELTPREEFVTRSGIERQLLYIAVGGLSIALAAFGGDRLAFWSGISYALLGPVMGLHGAVRGRAERLRFARTP